MSPQPKAPRSGGGKSVVHYLQIEKTGPGTFQVGFEEGPSVEISWLDPILFQEYLDSVAEKLLSEWISSNR